MKKLIILSIFILACVLSANAQTDCPLDKVCLSPEAARAALEAGDKVTALETEVQTLRIAVLDQKGITNDVKIELAKQIGEKTGAQAEAARLSAIVEFLLKNGRKKCYGICVQF